MVGRVLRVRIRRYLYSDSYNTLLTHASLPVSPTAHFTFNAPTQQVERLARPVYLDEVYTKAQEERIRELPGMMSFDVYMHYINEFLAGWPDPTHELAKEVAADVSRIVRKLVMQRFAGVGHGALQYRVG